MSRESRQTGLVAVVDLGAGSASSSTFLRGDQQWAAPPAGGSPPTGTGFRHITAGVEDAAAKLVDTADVNADQITFALLQNLSGNTRFVGRFSAGAGDAEDLSGASATQMLSKFTSAAQGVVAGSGGGTTNFLRADGTWAAPGGGSDPWTYKKLAADFLTSSASAVTVAGLSFAPTAGNDYEFQSQLLLRTNAALTNPRVGLAWATGLSDGIAVIQESQAATGTPLFASGNTNAALLIAVGGLPNATQSWPARIDGWIQAGASPGGTMQVQLASETAGTTVTIKAGSYLAYRTI